MKWEYKRIVLPGNLTLDSQQHPSGTKRYKHNGNVGKAEISDPVEDQFNTLGNDGWELVTATLIDGAQNQQHYIDNCVIEYLFKRTIK